MATPSAFRMIGSWSLLASMVRGLQKIKVTVVRNLDWIYCSEGLSFDVVFSNQHSEWSLEILECCTCYLFRYANWKGIFWDKRSKVHHAASSFPGSLLALGVWAVSVSRRLLKAPEEVIQMRCKKWVEDEVNPKEIRREVLSTSIDIWDIEFLCATFVCVVKIDGVKAFKYMYVYVYSSHFRSCYYSSWNRLI